MSDDFAFLAGDASLDLVNTLMHRSQPGGPDDLLTDDLPGAGLLGNGDAARRWFVAAGLLTQGEAARLDAETTQHAARRLRGALDAVYRPLARRQPGGAAAARGLATLNAVLDQGRERVQLRREGEAFSRATHFEVIGPPDPSVGVARAAAELLHRLEPLRLRECENPDCDLLFYDESRNGSRRWCSMQGCGNQQKQARFRRARSAQAKAV